MNFWTLEEFNLFYEQLEKEESKVIFSILFGQEFVPGSY